MQRFLLSLGLGSLGVAIGCTAVWYAASSWSSFSDDWLMLPCLLPVFGIAAGCALACKLPGGQGMWPIRQQSTCVAFALLAGVLSGAGNHFRFVITTRTWNANEIPPEAAGFVFQVTHPWDLPPIYEKNQRGATFEKAWGVFGAAGFFAGLVATYFFFRRSLTDANPAADQPAVPAEAEPK